MRCVRVTRGKRCPNTATVRDDKGYLRWCGKHRPQTTKLDRLRAAVVEAAMGSFNHGGIDNALSDLYAACAAYDAAEKEGK